MARINYKVDQSLAVQGLLRVAVVAKALKVAPKTVNTWTKYRIAKIGGVKYLDWHAVLADKPDAQLTYGLSNAAMDVYASHVILAEPQKAATPTPTVVAKTNDAIAKAKALLSAKTFFGSLPELPNSIMATKLPVEIKVPQPPEFIQVPEEILTVKTNDDPELLTLHPDYKHLLRKAK